LFFFPFFGLGLAPLPSAWRPFRADSALPSRSAREGNSRSSISWPGLTPNAPARLIRVLARGPAFLPCSSLAINDRLRSARVANSCCEILRSSRSALRRAEISLPGFMSCPPFAVHSSPPRVVLKFHPAKLERLGESGRGPPAGRAGQEWPRRGGAWRDAA